MSALLKYYAGLAASSAYQFPKGAQNQNLKSEKLTMRASPTCNQDNRRCSQFIRALAESSDEYTSIIGIWFAPSAFDSVFRAATLLVRIAREKEPKSDHPLAPWPRA